MFEDYTYELLLADVLANAPSGVDTRQGSIFYDAVSGILIKVAKLYADLDLVFELTQMDTTTDQYLDIKASEYGITRHPATSTQYNVTFTGTIPDTGERFFTNGIYFTLRKDENEKMYLEAETAGTAGNDVLEGTPAIPVNNIQGLAAATFGEIVRYGADKEDDEHLRTRVHEKISGSAENGNRQHYKTWCESIEGVGLARIISLWNGPNTVKAVLISTVGTPCSERTVQDVQDYIDPAAKGYTACIDGKTYIVGDGLGEGVANLGAHFTAAAADEVPISVRFSAQLRTGTDEAAVRTEVTTALVDYLRNLVLNTENASDIAVRLSNIGAVILSVPSVLDYSNLTLNGGMENIFPDENSVPVLEEVTLDVVPR